MTSLQVTKLLFLIAGKASQPLITQAGHTAQKYCLQCGGSTQGARQRGGRATPFCMGMTGWLPDQLQEEKGIPFTI